MQAPRGRWDRDPTHCWPGTRFDGGEWSASSPGRASPPGKGPPVPHWIGGCVGLRAGMDKEARGTILCFCWDSNPGHPVSWQTLHWLRYPSPNTQVYYFFYHTSLSQHMYAYTLHTSVDYSWRGWGHDTELTLPEVLSSSVVFSVPPGER
jgi:hypothetical protein